MANTDRIELNVAELESAFAKEYAAAATTIESLKAKQASLTKKIEDERLAGDAATGLQTAANQIGEMITAIEKALNAGAAKNDNLISSARNVDEAMATAVTENSEDLSSATTATASNFANA